MFLIQILRTFKKLFIFFKIHILFSLIKSQPKGGHFIWVFFSPFLQCWFLMQIFTGVRPLSPYDLGEIWDIHVTHTQYNNTKDTIVCMLLLIFPIIDGQDNSHCFLNSSKTDEFEIVGWREQRESKFRTRVQLGGVEHWARTGNCNKLWWEVGAHSWSLT